MQPGTSKTPGPRFEKARELLFLHSSSGDRRDSPLFTTHPKRTVTCHLKVIKLLFNTLNLKVLVAWKYVLLIAEFLLETSFNNPKASVFNIIIGHLPRTKLLYKQAYSFLFSLNNKGNWVLMWRIVLQLGFIYIHNVAVDCSLSTLNSFSHWSWFKFIGTSFYI